VPEAGVPTGEDGYEGQSIKMKPATLLLVDDDDLTRDLLNTELTDAGFELVVARDGVQALSELNADATRFKAVITDVKLGYGPDGWDVGRRTRELVSDMPIVYISGDSAHEWASKGVPESVVIAKPFAPAQLVTAVSILINDTDAHRPG
jgi:DNA-binding response OmpR family regulator